MSNVDLARNGFEAVQRGDLDALAGLLAPDVKWHGGDPGSGCQDRGEALAMIRQAVDNGAVPTVIDVVGNGDKVVVEHTGGANLTTFRDGKVVEMVHYPDPGEARRAAGIPG